MGEMQQFWATEDRDPYVAQNKKTPLTAETQRRREKLRNGNLLFRTTWALAGCGRIELLLGVDYVRAQRKPRLHEGFFGAV